MPIFVALVNVDTSDGVEPDGDETTLQDTLVTSVSEVKPQALSASVAVAVSG